MVTFNPYITHTIIIANNVERRSIIQVPVFWVQFTLLDL